MESNIEPPEAEHETRYLTFTIAGEEYGIDILRVQEIRGFTPLTSIPNAPPVVKGVMNLRGAVVPVFGLREAFGLPAVVYDKFSVIIVVSLEHKAMGVLVDAVSDVVSFTASGVAPAPELGTRVDTSLVAGVGKTAGGLVVLLDIERVAASAGMEPESSPIETRAVP